MNGSTAKLLRKYATISGHPKRDLKRIYRTYPRRQRFALKQMIREDIQRLQALKRQTAARQEHFSQTPLHPEPAAATPLPWWRVFFSWLISAIKPITSNE